MVLIALLMIVVPLWRNREWIEEDTAERNITIARQRLTELKQMLQSGGLSQAQFDEQYQELQQTLSNDLDNRLSEAPLKKQGRWIILPIIVLLPLVSLGLYFALGDSQALYKAEQQQQARKQEENIQQNIYKMVAGLAERLKQQPDDAEGWLMLGRSYKYLQQYQGAAQAYAEAYRLVGDEVGVMLSYADALAMANGGRLSGQPAELIFKALTISPNDVTGLWLGGMAKAEAGELGSALQYWQKLETLLPADSKSHQELLGLMSALKSRLQQESGKDDTVASVNLTVDVTLADAIRSKVKPEDTVFVYAQALEGPKMPLAIVRQQVSDLPLSVQLNDSMAMTPAMKLSGFDRVKIIARISKTGTAMQQPGDLIGFAEVSKLSGDSAVAVTIDREVK